ncbi:MAG: tyrosine-type recombinase/integrase [Nanoarchaeota archaeon]
MERPPLDIVEWNRLLASVRERRDKLILWILYATGCSEKEFLSLRRKDVDTQQSCILFGTRTAFIPAVLCKELISFCTDQAVSTDAIIFSSRQSSHMSAKRLQQIVGDATEQVLNTRLTPTILRKTHIYHALQKNISLPSIAHQVGISYQRISQIIEEVSPQLGAYRYEL